MSSICEDHGHLFVKIMSSICEDRGHLFVD